MSDAGESSDKADKERAYMAGYMRDRRRAKKLGFTVKQWRQAGCPAEAAKNDGVGDGIPAPESSPVAAPDAI